ncbi:ATP-dependent Clp protease proteolytic subunit [Streptomyces sp. XM83C]|uniref:ATP-dependent Clp protease proteolytic subunit n=1 Tax=Streptomyces thermocoprophilus TaxID=78356 RepID=A0ABV5VHA8_9ACTN|nr:ATP-dependent Clp protease proteolytic subunit [Streptomyces sp. XM83C]MCK1819868.1 ATP-dependent Clp protease proteolytic subunit [Streptomyces sp. XM83C]
MTRPTARHVLPEFTERTTSGARTTDPYSKLAEGRIVFLGTPVDDTVADDLTAQFMYLEHLAPDRDIALYINSPGGSLTAMTAVHDTMRYVSCDVETVCLGQAGPAAAVLLAAGTPGKRAVLPGARVTIRQPALTEPVEGQVSDLVVHAGELARSRSLLEELLARYTGHSRERIREDIERELILDARASVEYGLADRVLERRRPVSAPPAGR